MLHFHTGNSNLEQTKPEVKNQTINFEGKNY